MRMSPQQERTFTITWRAIAVGLLSIIVYFVIDIHNKVNQSHEFRIQQTHINEDIKKTLGWIMENQRKMDLDIDKISEKQYLLESKTNRIERN